MATPAPLNAQDGDVLRRTIRGLAFVGNRSIDDAVLRASIATTASNCGFLGLGCVIGLGERRVFDEREFRRDVLRLRILYNQSGFPQARIDTLVARSGEAVRVRFLIREADPIRVTRLEIRGTAGIIAPEELTRRIPLAVGRPFSRFHLQASADTILLALHDRGHPYAQVFRSFDEDRGRLEAQVTFDVDPGPRAIVEQVTVVGADRVSPATIQRMIPVRADRLYRRRELLESQRVLYGTDLFGYVNVSLADTVPGGPHDTLVAVEVQVSESDLHRIRLGAGYGSVDCLRALAGWTARNFLGGGRRLDVTARVSKLGAGGPTELGLDRSLCFGLREETDPERLEPNYTLSASFHEPVFLSRQTTATVSVTAERRSEVLAFLREAVGGDLAVTRPFFGVPVTFTYALTYGRTVAQPAVFCGFLNVCVEEDTRIFTQRRVQSVLGVLAARDRRDFPLNPQRGHLVTAEARWASRVIGSDSLVQFTRLVGEISSYHPLGRRAVLAWRVRGGTIIPPTLRFSGQESRFVPPDERFYGGGPYTVRGFGQNQLGPLVWVLDVDSLDSDGDGAFEVTADTLPSPTGGNQLLFANVELRLPLPGFGGRLSGALFLDVGQVFERGDEVVDLSRLRATPGAGLRINSPLGPVRLDVAYNPHALAGGRLFLPEDGQLTLVNPAYRPTLGAGLFDRLRFHFAVGQPF